MATLSQNISPALVYEAKVGNKGGIERLTEMVRERLFPYIYRLTLDYNLSQDILQETILFMLESLNKLEQVEHFWHWLFRTALGKVQHHYRQAGRARAMEMSDAQRLRIHSSLSANINDGLSEMLRKELSDAIFTAMKRLSVKYRNIIILRCYENLEYSEIASMMNISELHSRVMFFRAKNSLRRKLIVQGFNRGYFVMSLALFGVLTTSAKASAACTISAASLDAGFIAPIVATISGKIGIATAAGLAALFFAMPIETYLCFLALAGFSLFCLFLVGIFSIYGN
jgi:RNA polymerase sigma-70 factor (ECF subfamily)